MFSFEVTAAMEGNSSTLEEDLDRDIAQTDIQSFMNQLVGNTVVMVIDFNVVIDIDLCFAPLGKNKTMDRKRFEGGFVQGFKEALARVPSSFSKGRLFKISNCFAMASLRSVRPKKVWCLRGARTQRSTCKTPDSTFALSRAFWTRAGIMTVP